MENNSMNVRELSHQEMLQVNGGGAFLDAIRDLFRTVSNFVEMSVIRIALWVDESLIESLFQKND